MNLKWYTERTLEPAQAPHQAIWGGWQMSQQKRVQFDFEIEFTNGGGIQGQDFRLDIAGDDIADTALADYIVADMRLLMVGAVRILNKRIIAEPHKRAPIDAPGTEFQIGKIEMVSNTGTYVDCPFHRFAEGKDTSQVELDRFADLPGIVVRADYRVSPAVDAEAFHGK